MAQRKIFDVLSGTLGSIFSFQVNVIISAKNNKLTLQFPSKKELHKFHKSMLAVGCQVERDEQSNTALIPARITPDGFLVANFCTPQAAIQFQQWCQTALVLARDEHNIKFSDSELARDQSKKQIELARDQGKKQIHCTINYHAAPERIDSKGNPVHALALPRSKTSEYAFNKAIGVIPDEIMHHIIRFVLASDTVPLLSLPTLTLVSKNFYRWFIHAASACFKDSTHTVHLEQRFGNLVWKPITPLGNELFCVNICEKTHIDNALKHNDASIIYDNIVHGVKNSDRAYLLTKSNDKVQLWYTQYSSNFIYKLSNLGKEKLVEHVMDIFELSHKDKDDLIRGMHQRILDGEFGFEGKRLNKLDAKAGPITEASISEQFAQLLGLADDRLWRRFPIVGDVQVSDNTSDINERYVAVYNRSTRVKDCRPWVVKLDFQKEQLTLHFKTGVFPRDVVYCLQQHDAVFREKLTFKEVDIDSFTVVDETKQTEQIFFTTSSIRVNGEDAIKKLLLLCGFDEDAVEQKFAQAYVQKNSSPTTTSASASETTDTTSNYTPGGM